MITRATFLHDGEVAADLIPLELAELRLALTPFLIRESVEPYLADEVQLTFTFKMREGERPFHFADRLYNIALTHDVESR